MISKIKVTVLFFSLYFSIAKISAQESQIKVNYKVNDANKNVEFSYEKTDPGTYTVRVKLNRLTNTSTPDQQDFSVKGLYGGLLTLRPDNKEQGIGFSYTYSYIRGKLKPKYDADFVYTLPCKRGSKVRVAESGFIGAMYFGNTTPEDWKFYRFYTPNEDTVTAARKGMVVEIKDVYQTDATDDMAFTSKTNDITIEHADGTLGVYRGFKKGSIAVKVGQTVIPGNTLGLNSRYNANSQFNIAFTVMYLKSMDFEGVKSLQNAKSLYGFVTPHFSTAENPNLVLTAQKDYTAADTPDIIKKEFSKKELKAYAN